MISVLRRPSLVSGVATRLAGAVSSIQVLPSPSPTTCSTPPQPAACLPSMLPRRWLHPSHSPLQFRSTISTARGETVVEDFYDEEKVKSDEGLDVAKLDIAKVIVSRLERKGITKLFPIQRAVLEPAMQGRDMIGRAKTGTGKTLAFGIPILDKIIRYNEKHGRGRNPLAIVLAPTRELARQVEKEFKESSDLDTLCVYGGTPINQQMRTLDYGVDIVVGTPGRIIDLLKRNALNLSEVKFAVLDEADQMLNVGFEEDVEVIMEKLPQNRQTMMFSATMPNWIRKITQKYLRDPLVIDLVGESDQKLAEGISLYSVLADHYGKASILGPLIRDHAKGGKCIVFTQTKRDADRLSNAMGRNYACQPLHGDISQNQRERTLSGFRDGRFNILIATDVAARGLDIPNVDLVVHYELPNTSELFVHRSGRTGRAGKKGSAILIHTHEQRRAVRVIEQDVGCKFIEISEVTADGGVQEMFNDTPVRSYDSYGGGRSGWSSSGRGGGGFGRSSFGGSDGGGGRGFGRSSYGGSDGGGGRGFGRSSYGGSDGGFGGFGSSGQSSGGRGNFGDSNSSQSGGFGGSSFGRYSRDNDSDSGRSGRSGGFGSGIFGSLGSRRSDDFGGFGSKESTDDGWGVRK